MELEELSFKVLSGLIPSDEGDKVQYRHNIEHILSILAENIFEQHHKLLYGIIKNTWRYRKFVSEEYLIAELQSNIEGFIRHYSKEEWTKVPDKYNKVAQDVFSLFNSCKDVEDYDIVSTDSFKYWLDMFIAQYKSKRMRSALLAFDKELALANISEEKFEKAERAFDMERIKIESIVSTTAGSTGRIVVSPANWGESKGNTIVSVPVGKFGLTELDEGFLPLSTAQLITVIGESKAGKTRLGIQFIHEGLIAGTNCAIGAIEMLPAQYESAVIARHIMYHKKHYTINDSMVYKYLQYKRGEKTSEQLNAVLATTTPEQMEIIDGAEYDLYNNPAYGRLNIFPAGCDVEELESVFEREYSIVPFKMILFDYPALLSAKNRNLSKTEITSRAYIALKKIANTFRGHGLCVIAPNQMTDEGIKMLKRGENVDQTISGDSREAVKSCDLCLAITKQGVQNEANERAIAIVVSRFASSVPRPFVVFAHLGLCLFLSNKVD